MALAALVPAHASTNSRRIAGKAQPRTLDIHSSRNQFQSSFDFPSFGGSVFGRRPQPLWPSEDIGEGPARNQGMRRPMRDGVLLNELYEQRPPEEDYLGAYAGLVRRPLPYSFIDDCHRDRYGSQQNRPVGDDPHHGFETGRYNTPSSRFFDGQPD